VFNSPATIAGEFIEVLAPGCFAASLRTDDVLALLHHDHGKLLGRTSSGTLKLREDSKGLAFELSPDASTPDGATAIGLIGRGDLAKCSFGFRVLSENWDDTGSLPLRTILALQLIEISIVAHPAYETTSAAMRSLAHHRANEAIRRKMELDHRVRGIKLV
jgi:HK97 family phage prohead protease